MHAGVGLIERGLPRRLLPLPPPLKSGLPHGVAAEDKSPAIAIEHFLDLLFERLDLECLLDQRLLDPQLGQGRGRMKPGQSSARRRMPQF